MTPQERYLQRRRRARRSLLSTLLVVLLLAAIGAPGLAGVYQASVLEAKVSEEL